MNKNIFKPILATGLTIALASCSENSWNDHYLDGFEGGAEYEATENEGTYTITDDDYDAISKLLQAQATTDEEKAAAKAIASNHYFEINGIYPASVALPYFMNTMSFPYYLDEPGSNVAVTYDEVDEVPAELTAIAGAETYTVTADDYKAVWGSDVDYALSFSPSHPATSAIPGLLETAYPDATEGQYAIVSYNNSQIDPSNGSSVEEPTFELSDVLGSIKKDDAVKINGYVAATSTQGPIVCDASGAVFVYLPTNNSSLKIGDQVTIDSTVGTHNYGFQIGKGSTAEIMGSQAVTYPTPKSWTSAEIDSYIAKATASGATPISPIYSTFTGKVAVSGNYINIILDGTTVQLSPYGASDDTKALLVNDATVTVEGYVMAIASKGKFLNTVITKVNGTATKAPAMKPVSRAYAIASTSENAVYYYNGTTWAPAVNVAALSPADYAAMGVANGNLENPATYIPLYLKNKLPYALSGAQHYVVYNGSKCGLFVYDGTAWTLNNNGRETVTARFTRKADTWEFIKYLGKSTFDLFVQEKLELDRSYLFVAGNKAATPIDKSKSHGYLNEATVIIENNTIMLPNDSYAFNLISKYVDESTSAEYEVPEGKFLFQDSNGRFLYMTGTFNSPNLKDSPISNNEIGSEFLWSAKLNSDGTWDIVSATNHTMSLSISYKSFGFYDSESDDYAKPNLYLMR